MAEQNWYRRFVESYGPNFRIDINNPQMGYSGAHVYDIYGVTDQDEKANISLDHTGKLKFHSDRTIEIVAGEQRIHDVEVLTRHGPRGRVGAAAQLGAHGFVAVFVHHPPHEIGGEQRTLRVNLRSFTDRTGHLVKILQG